MLLSIVHSARRGGCRCRGQRTWQAACRRSETPVPGGARVVRCSGWKARATERDLRRPQASRVRKCLGGRLDAGTSLPALCDSLRGFAWLPTARKVPLPHNGSTTDLRLKPERPHSCRFVFYPPLIRVHSWLKIPPAFPPRLRVRPTATLRSGKLQAASRRGQNSGRKAPATFIRAHSCPFVVQHHPLRFLRGFAASRETNCLQLVWQLTAQCSGWKARATVCHSRLESPSSSL